MHKIEINREEIPVDTTGQKDITINFSFNNSCINGDAREIAIALNKEIQNAQKLGLDTTGQRDVTINMNFNNSCVNGDAQEIAIALNKEIENAQKLGLI